MDTRHCPIGRIAACQQGASADLVSLMHAFTEGGKRADGGGKRASNAGQL